MTKVEEAMYALAEALIEEASELGKNPQDHRDQSNVEDSITDIIDQLT